MRFTPSEMPSTEQVAVTVLREEGFENIHWESLIEWKSPYDFRATKEDIEYLIEVKSDFYSIRHGKIRSLREYFKPVIFLIIEKNQYYFISLEEVLKINPSISVTRKEFKELNKRYGKIGDNGRISLPKKWRDDLNWRDGDQVCLHLDSGRITVENLEAKWRKDE